MFAELHGTPIVMLAVDRGVVVGAYRRIGNTKSSAVSDDVTKVLPIHPYGLVTGWGRAALQDHRVGKIHVDIMKMMKRMFRYPQVRISAE